MKAMRLHEQGQELIHDKCPVPECGNDQVLIRVNACAVCRTDLHVCDGDLTEPELPLIPGHEIVGKVVSVGKNVKELKLDDRVGVPWLGFTCGKCRYCLNDQENLCDAARFTGYQIDGGYAEYAVADHRYVFPLESQQSDFELAPLLCAGLIGYRAYKMTGNAKRIGLFGFGAAAHILTQLAIQQDKSIYAFTRENDKQAQQFALDLGAVWSGNSEQAPEIELDAAILFAPVGALLPLALRSVVKGGVVVCAGIHMSDIPAFPYSILWGERSVKSVANLTRKDGEEFFQLIKQFPINTEVQTYKLEDANQALQDLRDGQISGAAVLVNQH